MPRQRRLDFPGLLHHVVARGIERCDIFRDDADRRSFVTGLGILLESTHTECFAWAPLSNHFRLLVRTHEMAVRRGDADRRRRAP